MCNHGENTSEVNSILLLYQEIVILNICICAHTSCSSIFCKVHSLPTQSHLFRQSICICALLPCSSKPTRFTVCVSGKNRQHLSSLVPAVLRKQAGNFPSILRKRPGAILAKPVFQHQVHLVSPLPCTMPDQITMVILKQSFDELTL